MTTKRSISGGLCVRLACAGVTVLALGCQSSLTGNEGNLTFFYTTDDELDFNKPIAIGAKLDLTVKTAGFPKKDVSLTKVEPANTQVLKTAGMMGGAFTLEGVGDGSTAVTVTATKSDGTTTFDTVNLMARKPDVVEVYHSCGTGNVGHYLVNKSIFVPYDLKRKNGSSVIGYGYHALQVAPETGLQWEQTNKAQWAYVYKTAAAPGDVVLTSTLESGKTWTVRLVDEGQIDGGKLEGISGKTLEVIAGTTAILLARPTVAGNPVCQPDTTYTVTGKTPDVCTVTPAAATPPNSKALVEAWSWVTIKASKLGVCEFDVVWPKGNKGQGATAAVKVNVVQVVKPTN